MDELVAVETRDGVMLLTLHRPEKKNALTAAMYDRLTAALAAAAGDPMVAAVLIAGDGADFCAGNDVADFLKPGGADAALRYVRALAAFPKPLVAAVQGQAVGVGTTMLLHCDLVYAAPDARFVTPFARLGLVPEAGSSLLLPQRIGRARAAAMLLLGEPLVAAEAERAGLVTALVASDALAGHARDRARALAAMPPGGLAATRRLLRGDPTALDAAMAAEERAFAAALSGPEAREAFAAFLEKRAPDVAKAARGG